ncbi:MAG: MFS transporter [Deltaproteobacteria bacterium]|nr:MFS transporter [Deltaproteobacteria bacterium]MBW2382415.1 MFS transporter [Deltaproteobacteria bacterium]MBW2695842.1 MFS transporter [Deltaproteobacteria bacterium]
MEPSAESDSSGHPAWTLALIWWLVLSGLGLVFPFYSLYLRENVGLRGGQIGVVMATLPLVGLVAQPLWGQIADRSGARSRVVGVLCLGTAAGYAALALPTQFAAFVLGTAALALFSTALNPGLIALSLAALPDPSSARFGRVRVMGTLGFGASVALFPFVLRAWESARGLSPEAEGTSAPGLSLAFLLAGAFVGLAALAALRLRASGSVTTRAERGEWRLLIRNRYFVRVLVFTFLTYLFTQGSMVLFPILVRAQGGGVEAISQMWIIMIALEIPLVYKLGAGVVRIGPRGVIAVGIVASALRWSVSGFATNLFVVHAAQIFHGITVWGIILGIPLYVDRVVPERLRSTAQGVLAMIGISLGSLLSNISAGFLVEWVGPRAPAQVAGIASLVLALALPLLVARLPDQDERER